MEASARRADQNHPTRACVCDVEKGDDCVGGTCSLHVNFHHRVALAVAQQITKLNSRRKMEMKEEKENFIDEDSLALIAKNFIFTFFSVIKVFISVPLRNESMGVRKRNKKVSRV